MLTGKGSCRFLFVIFIDSFDILLFSIEAANGLWLIYIIINWCFSRIVVYVLGGDGDESIHYFHNYFNIRYEPSRNLEFGIPFPYSSAEMLSRW